MILGLWVTQGLLMFFDEFHYHLKRGLGKWERVGHPLDTFFFLIPFIYTQFFTNTYIFIGLCVFSSLLVTKDEFVHTKECESGEQWLHSVLFLFHPVALFALWMAWQNGFDDLIQLQSGVIFLFMLYQIIYWNFLRTKENKENKPRVNNDFYNHLGEKWYEADSDPIAVLRVEQEAKNPWVDQVIQQHFHDTKIKIADIGCGAGFLSNYLAEKYESVSGLDASESSLEVARKRDTTGKVNYIQGDAYHLPFADQSMDVVCAMDFLEHVEHPEKVIKECSRILKPGGLFFFHTFNRNFLSWLIVIKFMEWFVPNTPKHLHVLHLFIKPHELERMMQLNSLAQEKIVGIGPRLNWGFIRSIFARKVTAGFSFKVGGPTLLGFMGHAKKHVQSDTKHR